MSTVEKINFVIMCVFFLCYSYQFAYIPIGLLTQRKYSYLESRGKRVAVLIAARNEQAVIGELIDSIRAQDYPQHLIDIVVGADNCSDRTAEIARDLQTVLAAAHALVARLHAGVRALRL